MRKLLLQKQREAISKVGKDRYECMKRFAEQNVMQSRKLMATKNPSSKDELNEYNRNKLINAYRHPFERIPEEFFQDNTRLSQKSK